MSMMEVEELYQLFEGNSGNRTSEVLTIF